MVTWFFRLGQSSPRWGCLAEEVMNVAGDNCVSLGCGPKVGEGKEEKTRGVTNPLLVG